MADQRKDGTVLKGRVAGREKNPVKVSAKRARRAHGGLSQKKRTLETKKLSDLDEDRRYFNSGNKSKKKSN